MNRRRGIALLAAAAIAGIVALAFWIDATDDATRTNRGRALLGLADESANYAPAIISGIIAGVLVICAAIFLAQSRGNESSE